MLYLGLRHVNCNVVSANINTFQSGPCVGQEVVLYEAETSSVNVGAVLSFSNFSDCPVTFRVFDENDEEVLAITPEPNGSTSRSFSSVQLVTATFSDNPSSFGNAIMSGTLFYCVCCQ